jgi:putative peptidoglycan lipid II flippase
LLGGLLQFLQHLYAYFRAGFRFGPVNKNTWHSFSHVLAKFCMTGVSMSVMELGLFIDTSFASLLSDGSVSLIYYANRFVGIPMGVFGVAFSTILLPYFSRIGTYAPKRLNFFLYESAKLVFWVTVPCMLALIFFANAIFVTLFVPRFTMQQAHDAGTLLIVFALGLFFFSLNKVLLNLFYALHAPGLPTIVSVLVTVLNIVLNYLLMQPFAGVGLVAATTISVIMQTILLFYFLKKKFNFHGYPRHFGIFMLRYVAQLTVVSGIFYVAYRCTGAFLTLALPQSLALFFLEKIGFWLWVGPLCVMAGLLLYLYRKQCGIRLYFLD